jgi:hypothetical protein
MSASINDGGPAFPNFKTDPFSSKVEICPQGGMTLRDWFAGQALAGICAPLYDDESPTIWKHREFAKGAYMFADAMLSARKEATK